MGEDTQEKAIAVFEARDEGEIERRRKQGMDPFEPQTFGEMMHYASFVCKASLLPDHIRGPADAMLIMKKGRDLGLTTTTALQNLHVIKGRVGLEAKMMVALIRESSACEYFEVVESTNERCVWKSKRTDSDEEKTVEWTKQDAVTAQLWNSTPAWKRYPRLMLKWKAAKELADQEYTDVIQGLRTLDELHEVEGMYMGAAEPVRAKQVATEAATEDAVATPEEYEDERVNGSQKDRAAALTDRFKNRASEASKPDEYTDDEIPFEASADDEEDEEDVIDVEPEPPEVEEDEQPPANSPEDVGFSSQGDLMPEDSDGWPGPDVDPDTLAEIAETGTDFGDNQVWRKHFRPVGQLFRKVQVFGDDDRDRFEAALSKKYGVNKVTEIPPYAIRLEVEALREANHSRGDDGAATEREEYVYAMISRAEQ